MKQDEVKQALEKTPPVESLQMKIEKSAVELKRVLPNGMTADRMVRIALTSIRLNPDLAKCTEQSLLGSLFVLAQIGLEPIAGKSYILPFWNNRKNPDGSWHKVQEAQAIIGYKGLIDLFYRHESALMIDMQTVRKDDDFAYEYGTNAFLRHKPSGNDTEVIGYYCIAKITNGSFKFLYMTKDRCMEHGRTHSKTFDKDKNLFYPSSPWAKEPDAMCMKTVLIQLAKTLPLSIEMQRAITVDETTRELRKEIEPLETPDITEWNDAGVIDNTSKISGLDKSAPVKPIQNGTTGDPVPAVEPKPDKAVDTTPNAPEPLKTAKNDVSVLKIGTEQLTNAELAGLTDAELLAILPITQAQVAECEQLRLAYKVPGLKGQPDRIRTIAEIKTFMLAHYSVDNISLIKQKYYNHFKSWLKNDKPKDDLGF